ncbi:endonuclease domain-containing protein [Fibrella sp. WM1]|uniref:endonuclease domain-containing protein n=1 Tax=Fibrella musci TaxID=3242485 RepID=UPI003522305D
MTELNNVAYLKEARKALRNGATKAEQRFWQYTKGSQLAGRKFRRQHSVGHFILDFYCPSERLAIELDGGIHLQPAVRDYDLERQDAIEALGIRVLRFSNDDVLHNWLTVRATILAHFQPPPGPLLQQEGEQ